MSDDLHAIFLSISEHTSGGIADAIASIGATTVSLDDVSDFDEEGGSVSINGTVYLYDRIDLDADTIHLASGLLAAVAVDDQASLWDSDNAAFVTERVALVSADSQEDGDPLSVAVDYSLAPLLAQGTFAEGQSVTLAKDNDGYRLVAVHGKNNQAMQRSSAAGLQMGMDNNDGNVVGLFASPSGSVVRMGTNSDFRVKTPDGATYLPVLASAFTVSSDSTVKTPPTDAPDALAIIGAAPASCWAYLDDPDRAQHIGPMANDLPGWLAQTITGEEGEEDHLGVDAMRMIGVLWAAFGQQLEINAAQDARIKKLEGKR